MPGQIPLSTRYYPSDFQVVVEPLAVPASGALSTPILYADRDLIIDDVKAYLPGGVTTTGNVNIKVKQVSGATAPTYATTAQDVATFAQIATGAQTASTLTPTFTGGNTPTNNFVPAGSWVWIQQNSATAAGVALNMVFHIRWRSQV